MTVVPIANGRFKNRRWAESLVTMNPIERATVLHFHRRMPGQTPLQALGWRDLDSQRIRFEVLCRIGDLGGRRLVDLGCGYGDFKAYVDSRFAGSLYLGVDQSAEFIEAAQRTYRNDDRAEFTQADFLNAILPRADYLFASGSLNYRCRSRDYPFTLIGRMWDACIRGIAFNLLDANVFAHDPILAGQDPVAIHDYCRTLDPNAELVTGYLPDDFTILMRK